MIAKRCFFGAALAALLLISEPSAGAPALHTTMYGVSFSGNEFWERCRSNGPEKAHCLGYVMGLMDGIAVLQNALARDRASYPNWTPICTPTGVTGDELVTVLVDYLDDNPDVRRQGVIGLFVRAVRQAWPCEG